MNNNRGKLITPNFLDNTVEAWVQAIIKDALSSPLMDEVPALKTKENLDLALAKNDPNPYVRARAEAFSKLKKSAQEQILLLEKENKTDDRFYKEFAQQVIKLGDQYSDEVKKKTVDKKPSGTHNVSNN